MDNDTPRKPKRRRIDPSERQRAVRACDQCRRVKEKCEGGTPCKRCSHFHRSCEFSMTAPASHDHHRQTKGSRATRINSNELLERSSLMESILMQKLKVSSLDLESLRQLAARTEGHERDDGLAGEEPGDDDDLAIENEKCTVDPVEETVTHFSGEFSYWNFSMRVKQHIEDTMKASANPPPQDAGGASGYWRAEQLRPASSSLANAIACFPPRQVADFLVHTFFRHAQTTYFLIEERWLIGNLALLYDNPGELTAKHIATVSIVLTVFAIGTQYASLDSPDRDTNRNMGFSEDEIGTMFYQQAIRLLPEIIELSSLESVQACLIFAVYALPIDASGLGYIYLNLAQRLAIQNGMHRRSSNSAFSQSMKETRNRVWWSIFALDRKICIFHGRPISTQRSDIESDLPGLQVDPSDGLLALNVAQMEACIHLAHYLQDFLEDLSLLRTCSKSQTQQGLKRLLEKTESLKTWWRSLPNDLLEENKLQSAVQYRASIHLRLEYYLVRMFVGRPFLLGQRIPRSHDASPADSASTSVRNDPSAEDPDLVGSRHSYRTELVHDCVQAAEDALEACRRLRDHGPGLASASYVEYSSCRASLLALLAYSIQNQTNEYKGRLRHGLVMIRELSTTGDPDRSAEVSLIESMERALDKLHFFAPQNGTDDNTTELVGATSLGYQDFRSWATNQKSAVVNNYRSADLQHTSPATLTQRDLGTGRATLTGQTASISSYNGDSMGLEMPVSGLVPDPFGPLDPAMGLAFFGEGPLASPMASMNTETQVLEQFLAMSADQFYH